MNLRFQSLLVLATLASLYVVHGIDLILEEGVVSTGNVVVPGNTTAPDRVRFELARTEVRRGLTVFLSSSVAHSSRLLLAAGAYPESVDDALFTIGGFTSSGDVYDVLNLENCEDFWLDGEAFGEEETLTVYGIWDEAYGLPSENTAFDIMFVNRDTRLVVGKDDIGETKTLNFDIPSCNPGAIWSVANTGSTDVKVTIKWDALTIDDEMIVPAVHQGALTESSCPSQFAVNQEVVGGDLTALMPKSSALAAGGSTLLLKVDYQAFSGGSCDIWSVSLPVKVSAGHSRSPELTIVYAFSAVVVFVFFVRFVTLGWKAPGTGNPANATEDMDEEYQPLL